MQSNSWVSLRGQVVVGLEGRLGAPKIFFRIDHFIYLILLLDKFYLCLDLKNIRDHSMPVDRESADDRNVDM